MKNFAKNDKLIELLIKDSNYKIHKDGKILSLITKTGKVSVNNVWRRIDRVRSDNYVVIKFNKKTLLVHRIIYRKFTGKLDFKKVVNHIDSNPKNNNISNLELISKLENNLHRIKNHPAHGVSRGNSKITFEIAERIREDYKRKTTLKKLCEKYNLCKSTMSYLVNNKIWKKNKDLHEKNNYVINSPRLKESCPKWLDTKKINFIYKNKPKGMSIDHIIPLKNKFVSGLHVPWNLQYLKKSDNLKKNSQFDFTYDNQGWKSKKSSKRKR